MLVPEGEKDPFVPEPETDEAELDPCAEPVPCPLSWLGLFRDAPAEPDAACAMDWPDAAAMLWPTSARALLLATPIVPAFAAEAEGENAPVAPEPETVEAVLAACADSLD